MMHVSEKYISKNIALSKLKENILNLLPQKNLSLSDLARLTGIQQSTLYKALNSKRDIHYSNVIKICDVLNITMCEFHFNKKEIMLPLYEEVESLKNLKLPFTSILNTDSGRWLKWVKINDAHLSHCIAVCSKLLLNRIFTSKAILIVDISEKEIQPSVYIKGKQLSINTGEKRIGSIKKILL